MNIYLMSDSSLLIQGVKELLLMSLESHVLYEIYEAAELMDYSVVSTDIVILRANKDAPITFENIERIKRYSNAQPCWIILAEDHESEAYRHVLGATLKALVSPSVDAELFKAIVRLVQAGGKYYPEATSKSLAVGTKGHVENDTALHCKVTGLSRRQYEVLSCAHQGASNKLIADQLNISEGTVKSHLYSSYRHLGVTNRVSALSKVFS